MKWMKSRVVIALPCLLMMIGIVGPGPFKWVLLSIAALVSSVMFIRFWRDYMSG